MINTLRAIVEFYDFKYIIYNAKAKSFGINI